MKVFLNKDKGRIKDLTQYAGSIKGIYNNYDSYTEPY